MGHEPGGPRALLVALAALLVTSCNAVIGGGVVAVMGGAGFLASQCYDRVRVRVRDPETGQATCSADVWLSDGDSERRLRPCYNAALTEGKWKLTARLAGYQPVSTDLVIPEHEGQCPSYTHSVELTLRRDGEPAEPPFGRTRTATQPAPSAPPAGAAGELETGPARLVPAPIPGAPVAPGIPTRSFEAVPAGGPGAPPAPAPAPAPAPSPAPPPAPAPPAPAPPAP